MKLAEAELAVVVTQKAVAAVVVALCEPALLEHGVTVGQAVDRLPGVLRGRMQRLLRLSPLIDVVPPSTDSPAGD